MFFKSIFDTVKHFAKDRSGNFAMVTTLMSFPMIAVMGLSVDLWQAYEVKSKLDQVADSAAIAAVSASSKAYVNATGDTGKAIWDKEAQDFFNGNKEVVAAALSADVAVDVQRKGLLLTSSVSYRTILPTAFMRIAGYTSMVVSGTATAQFNAGEYYDVHVLVDNSPSMGIGASQADVDVMNEKMGCAFACHDLSGNMNSLPYVPLMGVKLRIDVVAASLTKLADMITNNVSQKGLYKLSLYTLGARAEDAVARPLSELQDLTQDMNGFKDAVRSVQLMSMPTSNYNNYAVGYINKSMQLLAGAMPASGNGTGVYDAKQVMLLITDGVEDIASSRSTCFGKFQNRRCTQPIDVSLCQSLKKRGMTIAILHTTYLPIVTNQNYDTWVKPIESKVGPALQECASPNLYQPVDINSDIAKGLADLFKRAVGMPRLTG